MKNKYSVEVKQTWNGKKSDAWEYTVVRLSGPESPYLVIRGYTASEEKANELADVYARQDHMILTSTKKRIVEFG